MHLTSDAYSLAPPPPPPTDRSSCHLAGTRARAVVSGNLSGPVKLLSAVAIVANVWLTVPLICIVCFRVVFENWLPHLRADRDPAAASVVRALCFAACASLAWASADFATVMSFVGSVSSTFLTFVCPCAFYLRLHGAAVSPGRRALTWAVMAAGFAGGVRSFVAATQALLVLDL